MSKLSLPLGPQVVQWVKNYVRSRVHSVMALAKAYLDLVSIDSKSPKMPPVLKSLRGSLRNADLDAYGAHLSQKHR
jgi:hypothetical protein